MAVFFDRFREEIHKYAAGVHTLGEPASAADVEGLPQELASFLRSWNGAELFIDAYSIRPSQRLEREGDLLVFGDAADGDRFALRPDGAVVRLEADTGEVLIEGTSFARWLEGLVAAESVIYDREGEFRDGVFDDTGEELKPEAIVRRERKALRVDPDAPAPAWRLARALARLSKKAEAVRTLERVIALAPSFSWARFDLAKLLCAEGRHEEAEAAFAAAAEADPSSEFAGYFAAHAARVAAERGDEEARRRHAARALVLNPDIARQQREAARSQLAAGHREEARELLAIAAAVNPKDLEVIALRRELGTGPP